MGTETDYFRLCYIFKNNNYITSLTHNPLVQETVQQQDVLVSERERDRDLAHIPAASGCFSSEK